MGDLPASNTASSSAADKSKLDAIEAGAQVNPAFATVSGVSSIPSTTDGFYQTGASNSGSYLNSPGTSNTVACGDHKHSLSIPNASTTQPGLMSKTDKANLDLLSSRPKVITDPFTRNVLKISLNSFS